jgi:hypothetical protein
MRQGEIFALCWGDVDLAAGTVYVKKNLTEDREGRLVGFEPKTPKSRRVIHLFNHTAQRVAQTAARIFAALEPNCRTIVANAANRFGKPRKQKRPNPLQNGRSTLVEMRGLEPLTPYMRIMYDEFFESRQKLARAYFYMCRRWQLDAAQSVQSACNAIPCYILVLQF